MSLFAKRFPAGRWPFLGPGSETKLYSTYNERPQGEWDRVAELMMIKFRESGHQFSESRVHCLKEHSKAKEVENYLYISVPMGIRLKLFFAQIFLLISSVFTEESQMCVRNTVSVKQVRGDQSDPLFEPARLLMTPPTPSIEIPAQEYLLQKYKERVERLSQQDRVIKICTDCRIPENS